MGSALPESSADADTAHGLTFLIKAMLLRRIVLACQLAARAAGAAVVLACPVFGADTPNVIQLLTTPAGDVYAVTDVRGGLFRSRDGGRRWETMDGIGERSVHSLVAESAERLFALTAEGVLLSADSGASWSLVTDAEVAQLAFSPSGGRSIFRYWGCDPHPGVEDASGGTAVPFPKAFSGRLTATPAAPVQPPG
jgi:hypothetical protein